jgi:putative PIN family toxin of toxin-antitoxin system
VRVVLDAVILVRGLINPSGHWGQFVFAQAGSYAWIVSPAIVDEYLNVLRRPELIRKYREVPSRNLPWVLAQIATARMVEPDEIPRVCRNPEDDKFLAAAVAGEAASRTATCSTWDVTKS